MSPFSIVAQFPYAFHPASSSSYSPLHLHQLHSSLLRFTEFALNSNCEPVLAAKPSHLYLSFSYPLISPDWLNKQTHAYKHSQAKEVAARRAAMKDQLNGLESTVRQLRQQLQEKQSAFNGQELLRGEAVELDLKRKTSFKSLSLSNSPSPKPLLHCFPFSFS